MLVSFIRFIFNTALLIGGLILILMAVGLHLSGSANRDPRLIINGARPPADAETLALHPLLQARADEINRPLSTDSGLVDFAVAEGETAQSVTQRLQAAGLIHDAVLMRQLLRYNGIDTRLVAGNYQLRRNMSMKEVAAALFRGRSARMVLTVPAGWRMEQLADHLDSAGIMDGNQFLRQARRGDSINHPLLAGHPPGQSLEGYLFPGTYRVLDSATPRDLMAGMLEHMANRLPPNALELAQQQGLTFYEVLTLASIIERETLVVAERPLMASVYLNRLRSQIHLQADPTVQYAMGFQPESGQWWKTPVRLEEYRQIDSPYNTYLYPGLPPGPIASPSLESIVAVLQPAQTNYLFFVCRNPNCAGGQHVFAETYQEHLENVANYWQQQP